jgi:hypothetical protein
MWTNLRSAVLARIGLGLTIAAAGVERVGASDDFDRPPISYSTREPDNVISQLQRKIDRGEVNLAPDPNHGYLPALIKALGIPVESQSLVFSKTSLQIRRISPRTPRAIYFNDEVYVGYCRSGDVLEVSTADPKLGTVFYSVDQKSVPRLQFVRQTDNCLVCHSSSRTDGVPGHLVRSVFVDPSGQPILSAGSQTVDYRTPFDQRWGGWYVTGTHGPLGHRGNLVVPEGKVPQDVNNASGSNVTSLDGRFDLSRYLSPHSDIVALLTLEHQIAMHNKITRAHFSTVQAMSYEEEMIKAFNEPAGTRLESTTRRIQDAGDELVETMLFSGEAVLTATVAGTSGFTERFSSNSLRDRQGRSLRDFDLKTRIFRYPCSYLIYSESFDQLPKPVHEYVLKRLWEVLNESKPSAKFRHLSVEDRQAIVEILRDTKPGLPPYWH